MDDVRLIVSYIGGRWRSIAFGSLFVLASNLFQVVQPELVGRAVDLFSTDFVMRRIVILGLIILGVELGKAVTRFLMRYIIIGNSWRIENDIRLRVYRHLLSLPLSYYNRTRTGDIIARVTNDLTAVRAMIGPAIMYFINALILAPAVLVLMFRADAELALYGIVPFPFIAVMIYWAGRRIHRYFRTVQESYSDISAHVQENLNGIRPIKAYVLEQRELAALDGLSRTYVDSNKRVINLQSFYHPLLDVMASAGVIIVIWFGGRKIVAGETTLGTLVSLIMYIGMLVWPSIALGWVVAIYQRGTASLRRIQEILDELPERADESDDLTPLDGRIHVSGLSFSYGGDDGNAALDGVSFDLAPGRTLAVVGRTGSGKTTLINILAGVYDAGRGMIAFDGVDINDIPLSRLRSSISLVPQETFLFSETIGENIAFGRDDADEKAIRTAAEHAAIEAEIDSYPDGFQTMLGERGVTVSGGQRQRIAIARGLVADAPIVFFDDCLSNVDTETEMKILGNIKRVITGRTAVIVTHRLGAITDADLIIYMKNGAVSEQGTHDELMVLDGEYAALYTEQESVEMLDDGGDR